MNWKRIISSVLAAGMLLATPVQLLASAESAEDAESTNAWESLLTADDIDEENTLPTARTATALKSSLTRKRTSRRQTALWTIWAMGQWDVVTDPEAEGYNAGDRGQNYAWAAVGYGDWIYVAPATQPSATPSL